MAVNSATIDDVVRRYLAGLSEKQRLDQQGELTRFARWFGADARLNGLKAEDIERYQEQVERSGASAERLEVVRKFLATAHKQGLSDFNLGKFIKIKRTNARKSKDSQTASANGAQATADEVAHITREGYEQLKEELDHLVNVKRAEIAQSLYEARIDKDFRENAPFDAAKQHQAEVEARIRYLERTLATAEVVDQRSKGNRIGLGTTLVLHDLTYDEELTYTLVGSSEANPRLGRISIASPVGKALLDRAEGEEIEVNAPAGKVKYRIESVRN